MNLFNSPFYIGIVFLAVPGFAETSRSPGHTVPLQPRAEAANSSAYLDQCADEAALRSVALTPPPISVSSTLEREVRQIFERRTPNKSCVDCHRSGSTQGTSRFTDILNTDELTSNGIINTQNPETSRLYRALQRDNMPPEGDSLSAADKAKVFDWIRQVASVNRSNASRQNIEFISEEAKEQCLLKDLRTVPEADRPFMRYFSLTNLYNSGRQRDIPETTAAISRLVNSLSWSRNLVLPKKVDGLGTLLRIDLRTLDWNVITWDLASQRNPYSQTSSTPESRTLLQITGTSSPDLRADWFISTASQPPLYHQILNLPSTELEFLALLQADTNRRNHPSEHFSVGVRQSGVSNNNRQFSRVPTINPNNRAETTGYVYASNDFATNEGNQNIFDRPIDFVRNGGEIIATIPKVGPNGERMNAQVYFLMDADGNRINEVSAQLGIVSHQRRPRHGFNVVNGQSCFDCHDREPGIIVPPNNPLANHIRTNVDAFGGPTEAAEALARYRTHNEIEPIYERDRQLYQNFRRATGGQPGSIFNVSNRFEDDLNERQVAAELGLTVSALHERLETIPELRRRLALNSTGSIPRLTFINGLAETNRLISAADPTRTPQIPGAYLTLNRVLWTPPASVNSGRIELTLARAREYCRRIGGALPTEEQCDALRRELGFRDPGSASPNNYNPSPLEGFRSDRLWCESSTQGSPGLDFYGEIGSITSSLSLKNHVRCVGAAITPARIATERQNLQLQVEGEIEEDRLRAQEVRPRPVETQRLQREREAQRYRERLESDWEELRQEAEARRIREEAAEQRAIGLACRRQNTFFSFTEYYRQCLACVQRRGGGALARSGCDRQ